MVESFSKIELTTWNENNSVMIRLPFRERKAMIGKVSVKKYYLWNAFLFFINNGKLFLFLAERTLH